MAVTDHVAIRAAHWGTGLGHALFVQAVGKADCYLWVLDGNDRSIRFDERHNGNPTRTCNKSTLVLFFSGGQGPGDEDVDPRRVAADRLPVGFNGLTIGQLAEQTEMSKSGLFAHFRSKEQLQLQTLDHARRRFSDTVVRPTLTAPRGEKRVRELFERWLDWETDALAGGCIFVTASIEYDDRPGPMHDALVRDQRDWSEFIATVAPTAIAEGDFGPDVDPISRIHAAGADAAYHHVARLCATAGPRSHPSRVRTAAQRLPPPLTRPT